MRAALLLPLPLLLAAACAEPAPSPVAQAPVSPAAPVRPAAAANRTSMKGWELYSRRNGDDLTFALLRGTNRRKGLDEVASAPDAAHGIDGLERLLATLAPGEMLVGVVPDDPDAAARGFFVPERDSDVGAVIRTEAATREIVVHLPPW